MKGDIKEFKDQICKLRCVMQGSCIKAQRNLHWFKACPYYHKWFYGYKWFSELKK